MKNFGFAAICLLVLYFSGCAKPDAVTTFKSPEEGLFYTVETFYTHGPVSDTTRLYAHLDRNGKSAKILVLEGGDLTVTKIIWNSADDVTVCFDGGFTETFRSYVTLRDGPRSSVTLHNHLQEHCEIH